MTSWKKNLFIATAILAFITVATLIFLTPRVETETPLPNPNGYDDFLKASAAVVGDTSDWNALSTDELRRLVLTNQPAIDLIRSGLAKDCRVVPFVLNATNNNYLNNLAAMKGAAHALCAASRLQLRDGRTNDAALLAVECIQFGQESTRGGVLIDGLVGIAIQALGRARLEEALPGSGAATARKVVTALQDIADRQESSADLWKREAQWARAGRFGTVNFFTQFLQPFLQRDLKAKAEKKFSKASTDLQRTALRAAAHAYELEHGQPPATARDLVPQYLKAIPVDPSTGRELPLN